MATTYFLRNTGGTLNWNANASWSTVSPISAINTGTFPVATDTATLGATSTSDLTVNVTSACAVVDCTGYTGTLTHSNQLTTTGNVTFVSGMTLTSSATWVMGSGGTFTPSTKVISTLNLQTTGSIAIAGGTATVGNLGFPTGTVTVTGNGITSNGNLTGAGACISTQNMTMAGTGNWAMNSSANAYPLVLNGTVTMTTGCTFAGSANSAVTNSGGTFNANGQTLNIRGNITFNTGAFNWFNISHGTGTATVTLLSALNGTGTWTDNINGTTTFSGAFAVNFGNLTLSSGGGPTTLVLSSAWAISGTITTATTAAIINGAFTINTGGLNLATNLTGTASLVFNSTGTWQGSGGFLAMSSQTINTAGTLTLSGRPALGGAAATLTYTTGTVVGDGTEIFSVDCQAAAVVVQLPTPLSIANLTLTGKTGGTITFTASNTLTVTNKFRCSTAITGSTAQTFSLLSSSGGTQTKIIASLTGKLPEVGSVLATDIDSSGGFQVLNQGGTDSNTTNWFTSWDTFKANLPIPVILSF
jgi:hypothetical protein